MSTGPIITDLQKINPSAIIELFTLTTDATLHGSAQTYRFHNGTSLNSNGDIVWAGNSYIKMPIQAEGFAFPQEIYKIDRKSAENREVVTFELAAVFDLAGIRAPKRQCTRTEFPSIGTFIA